MPVLLFTRKLDIEANKWVDYFKPGKENNSVLGYPTIQICENVSGNLYRNGDKYETI